MANRPNCPECQYTMRKDGLRWQGRTKKQLWRCDKCGRTVIRPSG